MAYQSLRMALASNNDHAEAYNNLGVLESRKNRLEMARAFFQASYNISRHLYEPHYNNALLADKVIFLSLISFYVYCQIFCSPSSNESIQIKYINIYKTGKIQ